MRSHDRSPARPTRRHTAVAAVLATLTALVLAVPLAGPAASHGDDGGAGEAADKNALSRAGESGPATADPTTPAERRAAGAYVRRERAAPDPRLTTAPVRPGYPERPRNRYRLAGGCYTLQAPGGDYLRVRGGGLRLDAARPDGSTGLRFQATQLGRYLLFTPGGDFVHADPSGGPDTPLEVAGEAGSDAVWTLRNAAGGFRLARGARPVRVREGRLVLAPTGARGATLAAVRVDGCARYPEAQVDVTGDPHAGVTPYQEVRGYVDAHTHGMAFEFLGGDAHCGRPWHPFGAPYALTDCPDHSATDGKGAVLEAFLSGEPSHDPVGWPTFKDWPAPESLTHEGTYYRWLERSWRGGQRLFVNLLVENNQLCMLYPIKHNSCDDMDSIRLQARDMYRMQDYIDAQFGGPGRGFYRIVRSPFEARRVINAGKMAVVMGIETSVPFGCTFKALPGGDQPAASCTKASIDDQMDEVHALGVRQMELVNKFDNALSGIAGDAGETGAVVNNANFLETGTYWDMEHCEPAVEGAHDRNQSAAAPEISPDQQDALFGAVGELFGTANLPAPPVYPRIDHCNTRGLSALGHHAIRELAQRHMIFDPDHMSVAARDASLDQIEAMDYPGVVSSHSWSTPDAYPRIYRAGGFITPYAGDSTGFVDKWRTHVGWADPRYYFGLGYGADINGLGAQGDPRGADAVDPVTYPFTGLGGVTIDQQHAGERVYDLNVDGVAQYGLYPDWIEDLAHVADSTGDGADERGAAITDDMSRGAEAYLQMWERATGIAPDSCRNPDLRLGRSAALAAVQPQMSTREVMQAVGQPYRRLGTTFGFCARTPADPRVMLTVRFDGSGRVLDVG